MIFYWKTVYTRIFHGSSVTGEPLKRNFSKVTDFTEKLMEDFIRDKLRFTLII